ncbi:MAG: hypothetical protein C0399_09340 [Syntrophus sp. (in: bacteria)]|nr:hypothetical protein [Syntrophus sp. (in: bacteria)]
METDQLVGIVLVNYNGLPFLMDCLDSLLHIDYTDTKIIVVDNASTDLSPEDITANYPSVTLLRLSINRGFAGGNNVGIRWCLEHGCDYVLLLNTDTLVVPEFLRYMMVQKEPDCILVPKIYSQNDKTLINNAIGFFDYCRGMNVRWFYGKEDSSGSNQIRFATMTSACAMLIPRSIFAAIGYFDEQYFLYWEDTDLVKRAVEWGAKIKFVPNAVIYHNESSSTGGLASPMSLYYNHRNRLYFMFKHQKNKFILLFFLLYFTIGRLIYAIKYVLHGETKHLAAMCHGIIDFFKGKMGPMQSDRREL